MKRKKQATTVLTSSTVAHMLQEANDADGHALRGSHSADISSSRYDTENLIALRGQNEAQHLRSKEYADYFLKQGKQVPCKECGNTIPPARLRATNNAADHCVHCKERKEAAANSGPKYYRG